MSGACRRRVWVVAYTCRCGKASYIHRPENAPRVWAFVLTFRCIFHDVLVVTHQSLDGRY